MPTTRRRPAEERAAREASRLRAAALFAQGRSQAEVARELGVSRQAVHDPYIVRTDLPPFRAGLGTGITTTTPPGCLVTMGNSRRCVRYEPHGWSTASSQWPSG